MSITNPLHTKRLAANLTPPSSALPNHILSGYWHNWHASPAAYIPLRDVSDHFDVINVAFATPANDGSGKIIFVPHADVQAKQFTSDIAYLQNLGKKVLISIGGANGSASIDNLETQENFANSVVEIVQQYGFNGIDINLERMVNLDRGDTDFRNPRSASIQHLIAAVQDIRSRFGPGFILSLAPESVNVQGGFRDYEGPSGSYLPVIHALRDILTYLQVQHYNSGVLKARDHNNYSPGTADYHVAMVDMLLQGFFVQGDQERFFPPLSPEQIVIGLAASPNAVHNGYTALTEMGKALNYLMMGDSFGGRYNLHNFSGYPTLRGLMTWSINWDAADHHRFSEAMHSYFIALP